MNLDNQTAEFSFESAVIWAERFARERKPCSFDEHQIQMLMFIMNRPSAFDPEKLMHYEDTTKQILALPACQIVANRFKALGLTPYPDLVMFVSTLSDRPGRLVQYVSALSVLVIHKNPDRLTVQLQDYFDCIGEGVLSEASLTTSWLDQKVGPFNGLDLLVLPIHKEQGDNENG